VKNEIHGPVEVLVTGGNSRAGLAVARALARRRVSFLAFGEEPHSLVFHSRYVKNWLLSPSPIHEPERFLEFTLDVIQKHQIQLVIPVAESSLLIFDRHRETLQEHTRLAMASSQALRSVLGERINLKIAKELGIPCPRQFELKHSGEIPEMIKRLGFPIVLKPPGSRLDPEVPSFDFKVLYAHDETQLRRLIEEHCGEGHYPLFQECAVGEVHNLCCFAARGEVVAIHEYHSLRRESGVGVLRKTIEPIPEAVEHARNMFRTLQWDGIAQIAFFVTRDQKKMRYMETNGRFWASVEGSIHAGWDFPYWVYRYFLHGETPRPGPVRLGSQTCWHRGDLEALLNYYSGGEVPATGTHPGKLKATLQYLSGFNPLIHSDVFRWTDPLPAILDHWQYFKRK